MLGEVEGSLDVCHLRLFRHTYEALFPFFAPRFLPRAVLSCVGARPSLVSIRLLAHAFATCGRIRGGLSGFRVLGGAHRGSTACWSVRPSPWLRCIIIGRCDGAVPISARLSNRAVLLIDYIGC